MIATLFITAIPAKAQLVAQMTAGDKSDTRIDRIPAIWLQAGEAPSAFLAPGPFSVTWSGKLLLAKRQRLTFSFDGQGEAQLAINGKELLSEKGTFGQAKSAQTRLNAGEHEIVISYKSRPNGDARFRLYWEEASMPRQSVPPAAFRYEATPLTQNASALRRGRELFATQHCGKCHLSQASLGKDPMQEMLEIAPLIVQPGDRLNENWLRAWLSEPHQLRPGTSMPQLFDPKSPESAQQVADLAAFLSSMKSTPAGKEAATDQATILAGGAHFHELGCVACHTTPDQTQPDLTHKRIPLHYVGSKFLPGALASFLKNPNAYNPHRGMPDFKLSDEEIKSLAAFLTAKGNTPLPAQPPIKGDAERGKTVAAAHHCYSCHAGMPVPETMKTPSLEAIFASDWNQKGCLAPAEKRGNSPLLHLATEDREALMAFRQAGSLSLGYNDKSEAAERKFHSLRCNGCHARDALPALLDATHSESASLTSHIDGANETVDQSRPHLSFIGEMLQGEYLRSVISGSLDHKPRPWLKMRMPAYSAHAGQLSDGFSRWHGVDPMEKANHPSDPERMKIGKDLISADQGFGCTTCHGLGSTEPTAAFEVQGIYLERIGARLRKEWFTRWMDHPASITPGTKMPQYAPGGQSPNPALDGNALEQYDAIWQYLQSISKP